MTRFSIRTDHNGRERPFKQIDWLMFGTVMSLLALSTAFIFSTQFREPDAASSTWLRHLFFAGFGVVVYGVAGGLDYRWLARAAPWIYGGALTLLLLVFLFPKVNGAHRWIILYGLTLQPSEPAKVAAVIMLAAFLAAPDCDMEGRTTFWICLGILALPMLLIAIEPDLSSALVLAPTGLALLLYAGIQRKVLLRATALALSFALLLCFWIRFESPAGKGALPTEEHGRLTLPSVPLLEEYQKNRIRVFLSEEYDADGAGWSKLQSQIAVGSGGLRGKGFLNGTQNMLGFLPRTVAPTDFIFCVIAEESGFAGGMLIVGLYTLLLERCMQIALRSRDEFGRIIALGVGVLMFCHVFVNIAMTIGLLPITGLPLPLMSYGGSFMISTMAALGLVQSVYRHRKLR